ncbi:MAG: hypothetical protein KatS3mg050_4581 [Litorilinea sp.]|nr:MAG: hypothetical protein KatS3mg050_4581 [Litorilinea sp.]
MTSAVCDSGPLTHLWQIKMWPVFGTFETLHVAEQVSLEVSGHLDLDRMTDLASCALHIHAVSEQEVELTQRTFPLEVVLQYPDWATLTLARRLTPDLVLTDDLDLRRALEAQGQVPMGSVGLLLRAYKAGLLNTDALNRAIDALFVHSTLYLSPVFKSYVRRLIAKAIGKDEQ